MTAKPAAPRCEDCQWSVELPTVRGRLGCTHSRTGHTFHARWNRYRLFGGVCGREGRLFQMREPAEWNVSQATVAMARRAEGEVAMDLCEKLAKSEDMRRRLRDCLRMIGAKRPRDPAFIANDVLIADRDLGYYDPPGEQDDATREQRCKCGWPFADSREHGCVPGDCSMRSIRDTPGDAAAVESGKLWRMATISDIDKLSGRIDACMEAIADVRRSIEDSASVFAAYQLTVEQRIADVRRRLDEPQDDEALARGVASEAIGLRIRLTDITYPDAVHAVLSYLEQVREAVRRRRSND